MQKLSGMTNKVRSPFELQFPPAHPPATQTMASTLCSPSTVATSDVTCIKDHTLLGSGSIVSAYNLVETTVQT